MHAVGLTTRGPGRHEDRVEDVPVILRRCHAALDRVQRT